MERALRYELSKITELENRIYPTNAPENQEPPYLVYISNSRYLKDLDGIKTNKDSDILLNILCSSYSQMKDITQKVVRLLKDFLNKNIALNGKILINYANNQYDNTEIAEDTIETQGNLTKYVDDLTINNISEAYENELKLYRGIVDLKISYKEEY